MGHGRDKGDDAVAAWFDEVLGWPVIRVRDEDEAVRLANASEFGLAGSVWTVVVAPWTRLPGRSPRRPD